jgi:hypothetical protein
MPAGDGAAQTAALGTWLWIGRGARPTATVVEHLLQWRWPERTEDAWRKPTVRLELWESGPTVQV